MMKKAYQTPATLVVAMQTDTVMAGTSRFDKESSDTSYTPVTPDKGGSEPDPRSKGHSHDLWEDD